MKMENVTRKGHPCIQIKKVFWTKSLIQSVRKIKHHPVGYSGIWIRAMLCVQVC